MSIDNEIESLSRRLALDPDNPHLRKRYESALCRSGLRPVKDGSSLQILIKDSMRQDVTFAEFWGYVFSENVHRIEALFDTVRERGHSSVILDLAKLKYSSGTTALGSLVKHADSVCSVGGHVMLVKVPSKIAIVFEMLGLDKFFGIVETYDEAVARLDAELVKERPVLFDSSAVSGDQDALREWEYFVLGAKSEQRAILLNTSYWDRVPMSGADWRLTIRVSYRTLGEEESVMVPPKEEVEVYKRLEANLLRACRVQLKGHFVARATSSIERSWVFYVAEESLDKIEEVRRCARGFLHYYVVCDCIEDKEWSLYLDWLNQGVPLDKLLNGPERSDVEGFSGP